MNALYGVLLWHANGSTVFQSCRWEDPETADRMLWHLVTSGGEYTGGDILKWYPGSDEPVISR